MRYHEIIKESGPHMKMLTVKDLKVGEVYTLIDQMGERFKGKILRIRPYQEQFIVSYEYVDDSYSTRGRADDFVVDADEQVFSKFVKESQGDPDYQPDEDDGFIQDNTRGGYDASVEGKFIGNFGDVDEAYLAIRDEAGPNFFPTVWFVDDHGGMELFKDDTKLMASRGARPPAQQRIRKPHLKY